MASVPPEQASADSAETELDEEIESLQARIKALRQRRNIQISNIVSARSSQAILKRLRSHPKSTNPNDNNPLHLAVLDNAQKQLAHNQECLYRICSGITTFKVKDPDPYAADNGAVLGIRIEAFQSGRFVRPYYVFLNKPYPGSSSLRVHRHTVPPCIPLAALAEKYLPTPSQSGDALKTPQQNLSRFVKALRAQVAGYHNRVAAIAGMRKSFGLDAKKRVDKGKGRELTISDVSAADAEARQIRLEWMDGRIGRAVMGPKGVVLKCVVIGEEGRDRTTERAVLGGDGRIEGVADRLLE